MFDQHLRILCNASHRSVISQTNSAIPFFINLPLYFVLSILLITQGRIADTSVHFAVPASNKASNAWVLWHLTATGSCGRKWITSEMEDVSIKVSPRMLCPCGKTFRELTAEERMIYDGAVHREGVRSGTPLRSKPADIMSEYPSEGKQFVANSPRSARWGVE